MTFTEEPVSCDGSDSVIRSARTCLVPIATLKTTPYSLPWGTNVHAKVTAVNLFGNSVESDAGNGAVILTVPDPPLSFINVPSVTNANQIGLSWVEG